MKKISILLKVNGAAWRKKFIEFDEGNISLDFNDWISPRHIHIFIVPLFFTLVSRYLNDGFPTRNHLTSWRSRNISSDASSEINSLNDSFDGGNNEG